MSLDPDRKALKEPGANMKSRFRRGIQDRDPASGHLARAPLTGVNPSRSAYSVAEDTLVVAGIPAVAEAGIPAVAEKWYSGGGSSSGSGVPAPASPRHQQALEAGWGSVRFRANTDLCGVVKRLRPASLQESPT